MTESSKHFSALLKYWRGKRGLSQLDLALAADISSKHVSFLETGRSHPSEDMILRIGAVLDLPLRDRNALLRSARFEPFYEEPALDALGDVATKRAIDHMMRAHDPFPMFIMNPHYDVLRINQSAERFFELVLGARGDMLPNALRLLLEDDPFRALVIDWEHTAHEMISRLHQEVLRRPHDERLSAMLDHFISLPHIPASWRLPDFSRTQNAAFTLRLRVQGVDIGFLTTLTRFSSPQNITLEELQIESYFPLDDTTRDLCAWLANATANEQEGSAPLP